MQSVGRFNQSDINTVEWERGGASYGGGSNQTITKLFSFEEFGGQEFHGGRGAAPYCEGSNQIRLLVSFSAGSIWKVRIPWTENV